MTNVASHSAPKLAIPNVETKDLTLMLVLTLVIMSGSRLSAVGASQLSTFENDSTLCRARSAAV